MEVREVRVSKQAIENRIKTFANSVIDVAEKKAAEGCTEFEMDCPSDLSKYAVSSMVVELSNNTVDSSKYLGGNTVVFRIVTESNI